VADRKHGFQAVTSSQNAHDQFACRWLRAPATMPGQGVSGQRRWPLRRFCSYSASLLSDNDERQGFCETTARLQKIWGTGRALDAAPPADPQSRADGQDAPTRSQAPPPPQPFRRRARWPVRYWEGPLCRSGLVKLPNYQNYWM